MSDALAELDQRIKAHLQDYLRVPVIDRTTGQYEVLVDNLARTAMDYSKAIVQERLARKQAMQKQQGGRR